MLALTFYYFLVTCYCQWFVCFIITKFSPSDYWIFLCIIFIWAQSNLNVLSCLPYCPSQLGLIWPSSALNLNFKGIFFILRKCVKRNHLLCVCVFLPFCRSCFPWVQETDSWSRLPCMIVFLSQALVWLSCSSSWVCLVLHFSVFF